MDRTRKIERRSPSRPQFVEGWRKALKRKVAAARTALPTTAESNGKIYIWIANPAALLRAESCLKLVSETDWAGLNQIQDPTNRRSAIAARIIVRIGLSQASGRQTPPSDWRFERAENGKPAATFGEPGAGIMHSSVSHVEQLVVVAVSASIDIGVDVECIDQNVDKKVMADFCHLDEQHAVGGLPRPQEIREFLRLWTLKEAYTKLIGIGHELDFKSLKFTLDPVTLERSAGVRPSAADLTQFENFYVSHGSGLFNVSLAIHHAAASMGSTELQIVSLAYAEEKDPANVVPL